MLQLEVLVGEAVPINTLSYGAEKKQGVLLSQKGGCARAALAPHGWRLRHEEQGRGAYKRKRHYHRILELFWLDKTLKIFKSNRNPSRHCPMS